MNEPVKVDISIARRSADSKVSIDGVDVSRSVMGVELRAFVGELSKVTLTLSAVVRFDGEVGEVLKALPYSDDVATDATNPLRLQNQATSKSLSSQALKDAIEKAQGEQR